MKIVIIVVCLLLLFSCAAGVNPMKNVPNEKKETAGFFQGLWHGFIFPVTFVISLFSPSVGVYETHNDGGWYHFGYLLGLAVILGGSSGSAAASRRRDR